MIEAPRELCDGRLMVEVNSSRSRFPTRDELLRKNFGFYSLFVNDINFTCLLKSFFIVNMIKGYHFFISYSFRNYADGMITAPFIVTSDDTPFPQQPQPQSKSLTTRANAFRS